MSIHEGLTRRRAGAARTRIDAIGSRRRDVPITPGGFTRSRS